MKRPRSPTSSDRDVVPEKSTSSDSDVPLSTLKGRRKQLKKIKKSTSHQSTNNSTKRRREGRNRDGGCSTAVSTVTSSDVQNFSIVNSLTSPAVTSTAAATVTAVSNLPGCSKYTTTITECSNRLTKVSASPLNLVIGKRHEGVSGDLNLERTRSNNQTHSLFTSTTAEAPNR